jgi:hypothetical protein
MLYNWICNKGALCYVGKYVEVIKFYKDLHASMQQWWEEAIIANFFFFAQKSYIEI